ncbi:MAG: urease accessory protein UreJ [Alphaproteobacteria bacterium]|nr:urease accessory protein UreJ [Alphaproteobacteria bacterium]
MTRHVAAVFALTFLAASAEAHGAQGTSPGFIDGLAHPFLGLDHVIAALAFGLFAARSGAGRALAAAGVFLAALVAGIAWAWAGMDHAAIEWAMAASVALLGVALIWSPAWGAAALMALAIAVGAINGLAHGQDSAALGATGGFVAGIGLGSAALLVVAGLVAPLIETRLHRLAGVVAVLAGGILLASG